MSRLAAILLVVQASVPAKPQPPLSISLAHNSLSEQLTKVQLERLVATYDLGRWQFTPAIVIDDTTIPHSHPVLTLHTRHRKDDELLLSTYVHEQLHWFVAQHDSGTTGAMADLRRMFPEIPVGYPEGSSDQEGNYVHLIVIYLEDQANRLLLGELRAQQVMTFWSTDHYTWLYRTVAQRNRDIGGVLRAHGLLYPPRTRPAP